MKKIAVYSKTIKQHHIKTVLTLFKKLDKLNATLLLSNGLYENFSKMMNFKSPVVVFDNYQEISQCSFLISIGGDGTLLDTVNYVRDSGTPVIGFNIGKLGFLANTTIDDIDNALSKILNNEYNIDKRSLIKIDGLKQLPNDINYALNEIALLKSDVSSMIRINVYIDDLFVNSYWADGLIVSTPTGSTAYSLSCGGPIVAPDAESFIITPIASHNLTVRPIVVSDKCRIKLEVDTDKKPYIVNLDSRKVKLTKKTELTLSKQDFYFNLINLENYDFFSTIRNKLLWGLDKRN